MCPVPTPVSTPPIIRFGSSMSAVLLLLAVIPHLQAKIWYFGVLKWRLFCQTPKSYPYMIFNPIFYIYCYIWKVSFNIFYLIFPNFRKFQQQKSKFQQQKSKFQQQKVKFLQINSFQLLSVNRISIRPLKKIHDPDPT